MSTKPVFKKIAQVAMVVRDVEATARRYWDDLGIGPWGFYDLNPNTTHNLTLRGKPVTHAFRVAVAYVGDVQLELIEPLEGDNIYTEHLATHGEGLHHIQFQVENFDDAKAHFKEKGYAELQSGQPFGVCTYLYFDTDKHLASILELGSGVTSGKSFPAPDRTYPPS
jgi:hypothetical protein